MKGNCTYKKSLKLNNQQTISINVKFNNNRYMNLLLLVYCKLKSENSWTLIKEFNGSADGQNVTYSGKIPKTGDVDIYLVYGVGGYDCPVDIMITKFVIE